MGRATARNSVVDQAAVVGQGGQAREAVEVVVDTGNGPKSAAATGVAPALAVGVAGRGGGATGRQSLND
jgi:hypothetical protein